jgi:hypothetical protein
MPAAEITGISEAFSMMNRKHEGYPRRVKDVLDPTITFEPAVVECVKRFACSKPWRGTVVDRRAKFNAFHAELARVYGVNAPQLIFTGSADAASTQSCYIPRLDMIILHGMSVVTYLHEWGHKLHGRSEFAACHWSINLFRLCFPRSFARCRFDGHLVRKGAQS